MCISRLVKFSVVFLGFACSFAAADVLFTWEDESGTLHISEKAPPAVAQNPRRLTFEPTASLGNNATAIQPGEEYTESLWLQKVDMAKQKRREAEEARQKAQEAIDTANRIKQETEEFLKPWRTKNRIKRDRLNEINRRIHAANAAIDNAQELIKVSNAAEQTARVAEKEARLAEKKLFEQYQRIVRN